MAVMERDGGRGLLSLPWSIRKRQEARTHVSPSGTAKLRLDGNVARKIIIARLKDRVVCSGVQAGDNILKAE